MLALVSPRIWLEAGGTCQDIEGPLISLTQLALHEEQEACWRVGCSLRAQWDSGTRELMEEARVRLQKEAHRTRAGVPWA